MHALVTIVALVIGLLLGLAVGAGAVLLALRGGRGVALGLRDENVTLRERVADVTARLDASEAAFDDRLTGAVRAASTEAFQTTSAQFLELAGSRLETTVAPLKESLQRVGAQVQELDRAREQSYGALRRQVDVLADRTGNLANALRSPTVRGRWGESQLRNVVELAGMLEHCDFVTQASTRDGEGDLLRPDLVVRIPGGKSVVVDAKVPLAGLPRRVRDGRRGRATRPARRTRAPGARPHDQALGEGVLAAVHACARTSSSCSSPTRRCCASRTSTIPGCPRTHGRST